MALISSGPLLISPSSRLLQLHQESLKFRRVGIGIGNCRRKQVCYAARHSARIFLNAAEALMNRDSDLVDFLTVDSHGPDASRNHSFRKVACAGARHLDAFPTADS